MNHAFRQAMRLACFLLCWSLCFTPAVAQNKYFSNWPSGADPKTVGDRVAQHFLESPRQGSFVNYQEVCLWYGSLSYADAIGDGALRSRLQEHFQPLLTTEGHALIPDKEHVDFEIFG